MSLYLSLYWLKGFNGVWELNSGDGFLDANYILVQVGTCGTLAEQFKIRTVEQVQSSATEFALDCAVV